MRASLYIARMRAAIATMEWLCPNNEQVTVHILEDESPLHYQMFLHMSGDAVKAARLAEVVRDVLKARGIEHEILVTGRRASDDRATITFTTSHFALEIEGFAWGKAALDDAQSVSTDTEGTGDSKRDTEHADSGGTVHSEGS